MYQKRLGIIVLHINHPEPYTEMKKLLIQNFGASDQERCVAVTTMNLGNDKPYTLLWKMKSLFYWKPLVGALVEILRSQFLQALPSEIRLCLGLPYLEKQKSGRWMANFHETKFMAYSIFFLSKAGR